MSGPQTDAGRLLLDWLDFVREKRGMAGVPRWDAVANIEREAVAAYLASPETAEALARALRDHWFPGIAARPDLYPIKPDDGWMLQARAILAAMRETGR